MSFTKRDFINLSTENRLKKTVYAIRQYIYKNIEESYIHQILDWLKESEGIFFLYPEMREDWIKLYHDLFQLLVKENPFLEEAPFDQVDKSMIIIPIKIILADIRSPFNVGSIMRTCEAYGAQKLIISGFTPDPKTNKKVLKTSRNVNIPSQYISDPLEKIKSLKKDGYSIYALEKTRYSRTIFEADIKFPCAIIIGNEEFGVSRSILNESEAIFHIPMFGKKNSLNVSVAFGIAIAHMNRFYFHNTF